uniref:MMS19 nucleotide excision repair protein n=1 Tax=Echinococcus granulosus TaxID=6210 RepID=A0A068WFB2_ECHGR|nr:dna repair:transcription protein met18:mms19 [Echinococcus granulosus]
MSQFYSAGLTSPDGSLQKDAFKKLNNGIRSRPPKCFTDSEVFYVVEFYVSRLILSDPDLIGIILDGILWLAEQQLLGADCAVKICGDGLFSSLHIPSLRKNERRVAYRLLLALISCDRTRSGLILMKLEFVRGFIGSLEGEKDPECLMLVFSMHPLVLQHFELAHLAEEHFDCMAAYFPVDYTPPPGSTSVVSRARLAERLRTCLWAARHLDGGLLLPLLIEKATARRPEARTDALGLLADCLIGTLHAASFLSEFLLILPPKQRDPIPTAHVTAYIFALCNLVSQLATELDTSCDTEDISQTLSIVAGLALTYRGGPEEMDFVEILLKCLWPEERAEEASPEVDGWFAMAPGSAHGISKVAPQNLFADCLLTGVLASPSGPLLARLFHRLAAPLLWPKVDPLPTDDCFYQIKFEEIIMWTPHILFLNRLLSHFSRCKNLSFEDLQTKEEDVRAIVFNFSHTLKRSCCDLRMCDGDNQRSLTEIAAFGLLCRLLSLLRNDDEVRKTFLEFCPHVLEHMVSTEGTETPLYALRMEQQCLLAKLVSQFSLGEDGLLLLLFKLLQGDSSVELEGVAIEVLQRASCNSDVILNNLFTLLFQRCSDPVSLTPVLQMVSAVLFVTKSLQNSDENNLLPFLAHILQHRINDIFNVAERLIGELPREEAKSCLLDLLSSIRLVSSSLSEVHQVEIFTSLVEFGKTRQPSNSYAAVLFDCEIISALRPKLPDILLKEIVDFIVFNELCVCSATLINKFPGSGVAEILTKVLNLLLAHMDEGGRGASFVPTSRFVVLTLRGLLVSQLSATATARKRLLEHLLDILLSTNVPCPTQGLQRACLLCSLHLLLPLREAADVDIGLETEVELEPLCLDEEITHCLVNPLAVQKCFCLVGLRLRTAWQLLREVAGPSSEQASLEEAFLHGYLRLASLLPDNIVDDYASNALEAAVLGVIGDARHAMGQQTQALGLFVIARLAAHRPAPSILSSSSFSLPSSPDATDDFLEKLLCLRVTCASADSSLRTASSLRFNLARCLRFLVDLPPAVTARHRGAIRRLLEDLLDDDCQSVRLEAARAHNDWCLKV